MENLAYDTDAGVGKSSLSEKPEQKTSAEFSADIWKDIQKAGEDLGTRLKHNETFKRILDSLSQAEEKGKEKKADWTIAINFTTDFGEGQGVESGMRMLEDFAEKTKGKNLTIVAQAAIPEHVEYDEFFDTYVAASGTKFNLERYIVKDGKITKDETVESKGYADDLQGLLAYTSKNHPSKRMGLIVDSHGSGNEGLTGDTGHASVPEFVNAVKGGLKESGREKLDLIDFDTCLMGQNGAIERIRAVSDQIVASTETEGIYNAQNYLDPIARLMEKPESDGFSLARDIVETTHRDMETWKKEGWNPAVKTLSHFDMRQYDDFRKSLDDFGVKLLAAMDKPGNRELIEKTIDDSKKYGGGGMLSLFLGDSKLGKSRTDLKEFAEKILLAVDNGELKDPDRQLKRAAQEVLSKRGALVDSYHGEGEYKNAGGLSVFLPARSLRNVEKEANTKTTAGRMAEMTDAKHFADVNQNEKSRGDFLKKFEQEMFFTRPHFVFLGVPGVDKEIAAIDKASGEFRKADTDAKREAAFQQLHQAAVDLHKTAPFELMRTQALTSLKENVSKVYKANFLEDSNAKSGWSRFRLSLRDGK